MSLYVDGERSRQRLGFAKSLLNKIKMLGLKTKTLLYEGFLYRVQVIAPGLDKVAVTAPMGAAVMCVTPTSVLIAAADNWLSGFYPARAYSRPSVIVSSDAVTVTNTVFGVVANTPLIPAATTTYFHNGNTHTDASPTVMLSPWASELCGASFALKATDVAYVEATEGHFYSADGSQDKRFGTSAMTAAAKWKTSVQHLPSSLADVRRASSWLGDYEFRADDDELVCGYLQLVRADGAGVYSVGQIQFLGELMFNNVPSALKPHLLSKVSATCYSAGGYMFALQKADFPTFVHIVDATASALDSLYFDAHPEHVNWRLFACIYNGVDETILNFPLIAFLESVFSVDLTPGGVLDRALAVRYAHQMFPWPNNNKDDAYDSVMFHDHNGDVLVWTRKYGAFKINDTVGVATTTVYVPTYVTDNAGVRPEIYYLGGTDYYCVAFEIGYGVRGLYTGSPHVGWVTLASAQHRLLQVRCCSYSGDDYLFLGIMFDTWSGNYLLGNLRAGVWTITSRLDVGSVDPEDTTWAMTLFGDGSYTQDMLAMSSAPPATPQLAVAPYGEYATIQP